MSTQNTSVEVHEYAFDVKLYAAIRVKASSLQEARLLMRERVQCTEANFGAWPNGDPILAEVSVDEDEMPCYEVDGDPNHSDCDA